MKMLDAWRREVRSLVPRGFVRISRGEGLFASDYPRFDGAQAVTRALRQAGYQVTQEGPLARIDGTKEKYTAFLRALPCACPIPSDDTLAAFSLARRLMEVPPPLEDQPLFWIGSWIKIVDAGHFAQAEETLAAYTALCQRLHQPLPAAAGKILLLMLAGQ